MDVYGFRVVVDATMQCYHALGAIHASVQAAGRALPRFHRDSQGERLSVAAHGAVRSVRRADRNPDPHRGHGSGRRTRRRRALGIQDRERAGQRGAVACARLGRRTGRNAVARGVVLGRIPRKCKSGFVPGRGLSVLAQGQDLRPAAQRDRARLRLFRAYRRRQPRGRRARGQETGAVAHAPQFGRGGRDHHRALGAAASAMARMGGVGARAHRDPQQPQAPAARGRSRTRPSHARSRARSAGRLARFDSAEDARPLHRRGEVQAPGRIACRYCARQPHARPGRDGAGQERGAHAEGQTACAKKC